MKQLKLFPIIILFFSLNLFAKDIATYIGKWGSYGSENGQFNTAVESAALDKAGNVYILDFGNGRIQKFSSTGKYLAQWSILVKEIPETLGYYGSANSVANFGIAIDSKDNIYVSSAGANCIKKFTNNGKFIMKWGISGVNGNGQFHNPMALTVDKTDHVYVVDGLNDDPYRIQKFTEDGVFISQIMLGAAEVDYVAVNSQNQVYASVAYTNQVWKYASNGTLLMKFGGGFNVIMPHGLAFDKDDNLYMVDRIGYQVEKYSPDWKLLGHFGGTGEKDGQFNYPTGIVVNPSGSIYVLDTDKYPVKQFSIDSSKL